MPMGAGWRHPAHYKSARYFLRSSSIVEAFRTRKLANARYTSSSVLHALVFARSNVITVSNLIPPSTIYARTLFNSLISSYLPFWSHKHSPCLLPRPSRGLSFQPFQLFDIVPDSASAPCPPRLTILASWCPRQGRCSPPSWTMWPV